MTSIIALIVLVGLCLVAGQIFQPRYGDCRGCAGCALQSRLEDEAKHCAKKKR